ARSPASWSRRSWWSTARNTALRVTLEPGDFALFDPSRPYAISFPGPGTFEHVIYQVPRASLDARRDVGAATAVRVPAASSAGRLVSPYLRTLARPAADWPGGHQPGQAFVDAGLDLAVSALRTVAGHQDQASLRSGPSVSELKD